MAEPPEFTVYERQRINDLIEGVDYDSTIATLRSNIEQLKERNADLFDNWTEADAQIQPLRNATRLYAIAFLIILALVWWSKVR